MPTGKPGEGKPSIKVDMRMTNSSETGEEASAVIEIRISGSSAAARDRVAKAIGRAVQTACQNLAELPRSLH